MVSDAETASFCSQATNGQGSSLGAGANYEGVFACSGPDGGPGDFSVPAKNPAGQPVLPLPYFESGSFGFQCTELANRFFWVYYGAAQGELPIHDPQAIAAGFGNGLVGGNYVATLAYTLTHTYDVRGVQTEMSGTGALPVAGDIVSMWGLGNLDQDGPDSHVAVAAGNPSAVPGKTGWTTIPLIEENAHPNKGANEILVSPTGKWTYGQGGTWTQPSPGTWSYTRQPYYHYTTFEWLELPLSGVLSWGYSNNGELGDGSTSGSDVPVPVQGLSGVSAIAGAADGATAYALRNDGTVWAWGLGNSGQLGNGMFSGGSDVPVEVKGLTGVIAIAGGSATGYALRSNGTVWAWGYGETGALGDGKTGVLTDSPSQVVGIKGAKAIAASYETGYALLGNGTVKAWGDNTAGQLGDGRTGGSSDLPVTVFHLADVTAIAGGPGANGYALLSNGTAEAWGDNEDGQLGDGAIGTDQDLDSDVPVRVRGLSNVVAIAGGPANGYAVRANGTVWAWGSGGANGLGNGVVSGNFDTPVQVTGVADATAVVAGNETGYALLGNGTVRAWGLGGYGQLGNGTMVGVSRGAVLVKGLTGVKAIASTSFTAYAIGGR